MWSIFVGKALHDLAHDLQGESVDELKQKEKEALALQRAKEAEVRREWELANPREVVRRLEMEAETRFIMQERKNKEAAVVEYQALEQKLSGLQAIYQTLNEKERESLEVKLSQAVEHFELLQKQVNDHLASRSWSDKIKVNWLKMADTKLTELEQQLLEAKEEKERHERRYEKDRFASQARSEGTDKTEIKAVKDKMKALTDRYGKHLFKKEVET